MKYSKYSTVIIGSGMSGLYLANLLSECKNLTDGILIITKDKLFSGSSALAQGGMVSVIPEINPKDSIESHIKDTIKAGCDLNNLNTVKFVSENSAQIAQQLIGFGVKFDKNEKKSLNFTLEAAHSCPRILHANGDSTGRIIEEVLCKDILQKTNVDIIENSSAIEILTDKENVARGVIVFNNINKEYEVIYTNALVIATGGIGQLYKSTTNPSESTADGIAIASLAGAKTENMEFIQFHPTSLFCKDKTQMPLVSEAVRGEGAKLVDRNGCYFAKNYHFKAELAPRDVVARAINSQLAETNSEYVYLDISSIGIEKFKKRFPTITSLCEENNIDISTNLIPVAPAEHYFMGGIKVNLNAQTSIKNLYAIGECSSTGLHGANRLASNSLLECGVFAKSLADYISKNIQSPPKRLDDKIINTVEKYQNLCFENDEQLEIISKLFQNLKKTMSKNVGIIRNKTSLDKAMNDIFEIKMQLDESNSSPSKEKYELNNALFVATLIVKSAMERKQSIGAHFRDDEIKYQNTKTTGETKQDDKVLVK